VSVDTRVMVRRGNVLDAVARVSGDGNVAGILVAAPLPGEGRMVRRLADVTDLPVTVLEP
jgi:5,10-methylene-tetrahydrofolate dehydrogenase/methenyl tetrahydrofolate cyclohydrolase